MSISRESTEMPADFGTHHRKNKSGVVHASNTRRAGASNVRVTTSSRSDFRSVVVRFFVGLGWFSFPAFIDHLLLFQFLDDLVELGEARIPELVVSLDPRRDLFQSSPAELAAPDAPDLLRGDEPRLLQHAD